MPAEGRALRWREHSLFPYVCAGCKTRHSKGDGVYLDQSGPRTVTFDTPQCADTGHQKGGQAEASPAVPSGQRPDANPIAPQPRPGQLTLTVDLDGNRTLEVVLRGRGVPTATLERVLPALSHLLITEGYNG